MITLSWNVHNPSKQIKNTLFYLHRINNVKSVLIFINFYCLQL